MISAGSRFFGTHPPASSSSAPPYPSPSSSGRSAAANAGFAHEFQLVDVDAAESAPTPFYYQNLAEAEYLVSAYQYMRLLGYPAESVSIITTYRGQKHLIRDVVRARCAHPAFGAPRTITTVDKYQGQQNEYILLSLVRTKHVGHLRDVRRLVVALSRARKGLYVFGRAALFRGCPELQEAMSRLERYPTKLALIANEPFPTSRALGGERCAVPYFVESPEAMHTIVMQMTQTWESLAAQQAQQAQQREQPEQPDQPEQPEQAEQTEQAEQPEQPEQAEQAAGEGA